MGNITTGLGSTLVLSTSPTLTTPDIGAATATSINRLTITPPTNSATLTIADGKTLDVNNSLTLDGTDSTTMTLPASSTTLAGLSTAQTFSAPNAFSAAGADSTPALALSGNWFSGGSSTTTKPQLLIEPNGMTSTNWSTSGTGLGVNAASTFSGNLLDLQLDGTSKFKVQSDGTTNINGNINISNGKTYMINGSQIAASNLSNGTTGSGLIVLNTSPNIVTSNTSTGSLFITDSGASGQSIRLFAANGNGNYNNFIGTNAALVYGGATLGTGKFVIAPWSNTSSGLALDGNGNVGIGTTNPSTRFSVDAGSGNTVNSSFINSSMSANQSNYLELGQNLSLNNAGEISFNYKSAGNTSNSLGLGFYGNGQKLNILANGNVGIGNTTPNAKLSFANNVYTAPLGSSYGQYQMMLYDGGTASGSYGLGIENFNMGFNSAGGYKFYQGSGTTPLMVIGGQSSSNVGIGNTAPTSLLTVGSGNQFQINSSGAIAAATGITSSGTINFSGLIASSAVYTDVSKNLTTTPPSSGTLGYWNRSGNTLSPSNSGDSITTIGNISTTNTGAITSAGLITGSTGITVTGGAVSLNSSSNYNTSINNGSSTGSVNIGNPSAGPIALSTGSTFGITTTTSPQTFASSVATTGTASSAFVYTDNSLTSGTGSYFNSNSLTTGRLVDINTGTSNTSQTSGTLLNLTSTSTTLTTGGLLSLDWSPASNPASAPTGDLLSLNIGIANSNFAGNLLNLKDNGNSLFSVSQTNLTSTLPVNITAAGDTSLAYDLNFTNPNSSYIKSSAPITIQPGESFNSSDLTVNLYNQGSFVVQNAVTSGSSPVTNYLAYLTGSDSTTNADSNYGLYNTYSISGALISGTRNTYGNYVIPTSTGINTGGIDNLYGGYFAPSSTLANGSTENVYGAYIAPTATLTTGTVNGYGLYIANPTMNTNGTSTKYGLYIADVTTNAADNNYAAVFAGGNVGVGTNTPATTLDVAGTIRSGIFGSYMLTGPSAGSGWLTGTGINLYWNGSNFVTNGDTANNGGSAILGSYGTADLNFYTIPSNGGAGQTISSANIANYDRMVITHTGQVGIGTTSPSYTLDVHGTADIQGTDFRVGNSSGFHINPTLSSAVQLTTDSTQNLALLPGGNVGIGTTNPGRSLSLQKGDASNNVVQSYNTTAGVEKGFIGVVGTNGGFINTSTAGDFFVRSQGNLLFGTDVSGDERMRIDGTGKIGIGTNSPSYQLDILQKTDWAGLRVKSATALTSSWLTIDTTDANSQASLNLAKQGTNQWAIASRNTLDTPNNRLGIFDASTTERLTILQGGNIGIGTTSPNGLLDISRALSGTPSLTAPYLSLSASTFTDNNTAVSGTAMNMAFNSIATPTLNASNTSVITTNAYTLYISGAPTSGTNETITNPIAFGVGSGNSYFGGNVGINETNPSNTLKIVGSLCVSAISGACAGSTSGTIYATNTTVQSADLAENYISSQKLEPGEIIAPAGDGNNMAIAGSTSAYQSSVIGVISTNPGVTLNSDAKIDNNHPYIYPIALAGRVPVKVSIENGFIKAGDFLTASSTPGVAMKATKPGEMIGKALENYSKDTIGSITAFIHIGYADPQNFLAGLTFDANGNLVAPNISTDILTVNQTPAINGTLDINNGNITYNSPNDQSSSTSIDSVDSGSQYTSLSGEIVSLTQKVDDLENQLVAMKVLTTSQITLPDNLQATTSAQIINSSTPSATELSYIAAEVSTSSAIIESNNPATASASSSANVAQTFNNQNHNPTLTPASYLLASDSANLTSLKVQNSISTLDLTTSQTFKSLGQTLLGTTTIAGDLSVDGTFSITNGNSINAFPTLYIQNNTLASSVDFFNGALIISKDGMLTASTISSDELRLTTGQSVGSAIIRAGTSSVDIPTYLIKSTSHILLTPETPTNLILYTSNKLPGNKFTVSITTPSPTDIKFDWLIINEK